MTTPKFRAFIKATGEMHRVAIVNTWAQIIHTIPLPKELSDGSFSKQMRIYGFDEIELMQYTGMKDMNDKEIYEGDIVKYYPKDHPERIDFGFIIYKNFSFAIKGYSSTIHWPFMSVDCTYTVIGNIFQNPNLL